jgi:hypothetical protein
VRERKKKIKKYSIGVYVAISKKASEESLRRKKIVEFWRIASAIFERSDE